MIDTTRRRFVEKVDIHTHGCWLWTGFRNPQGYGTFWRNDLQRMVLAHREAYEFVYGEVPDGMCVLHECDNPGCVRVEHLFRGTREENMADRQAKGRQARGERMGPSKLTVDKVLAIRQALECGARIADLAGFYGVSKTAIDNIRTRFTWKHI